MKRFLYVLVIFIFAKYGFSNENFEYSMKMHEAFVLQSLGKSTAAFYSFQNGYMQAIKAGEHPLRLEAILGQFMWYRRFGSYTKLFAREPTGNDVISDQYQEESFFSNSENITNFEERLWAMTQAMLTTPCNFSDFPTTHHRKSNQSSFFFPVAFIQPPFSGQHLKPGMSNRTPLLATIPNYITECDNSPEMAELRREYIFATGEIIAGIFLWQMGGKWLIADGFSRVITILNRRITLFQTAKLEYLKSVQKINEAAKTIKD